MLIDSCEITFEPLHQKIEKLLPKEDLKNYLNLYEMAKSKPKKALKDLLQLKEKYPDFPEIDNLLSYVYIRLRKIRRAEELTKNAYKKFPDYLFARINYADQCLRKGKIDEIEEIFDHKFHLKELYPKRKVFHYSEFRGFMVVMGFYHLALGNRSAAEQYYLNAVKADPLHPSLNALEKKLFKRKFKFFKLLPCPVFWNRIKSTEK